MRPFLHAAWGSVLLATVAACAGDERDLPRGTAEHRLVTSTGAPSGDPYLHAVADRLRAHSFRWAVGGGPTGPALWGRPVSVAVDRHGHLVVLDEVMHTLSVLDQEGTLVRVSGREGSGPLELQAPSGIAGGGAGDLVVGQRLGSLIVIEAEQDGSLRERSRRSGLPGVRDLCAIDGKAYIRISSPRLPDRSVAVVPTTGDGALEFFPAPVQRGDLMERLERGDGRIACSPEEQTVIVTYEGYPFVHGFAPDGRIAWEAAFENFVPDELERAEVAGMAGISRRSDRPSDFLDTTLAIPGAGFLVQIGRFGAARADGTRRLEQRHTFLFSARTGESVYVGSMLPLLLHATDRLLISVREEPETLELQVVAYSY